MSKVKAVARASVPPVKVAFCNLPPLFQFVSGGREYTKISNAISVDNITGKDAIFALGDVVIPTTKVLATRVRGW
jgi:hypothetical protein